MWGDQAAPGGHTPAPLTAHPHTGASRPSSPSGPTFCCGSWLPVTQPAPGPVEVASYRVSMWKLRQHSGQREQRDRGTGGWGWSGRADAGPQGAKSSVWRRKEHDAGEGETRLRLSGSLGGQGLRGGPGQGALKVSVREQGLLSPIPARPSARLVADLAIDFVNVYSSNICLGIRKQIKYPVAVHGGSGGRCVGHTPLDRA